MAESSPRQRALEFFQRAYQCQVGGDYDQAVDLYTRSIEAFPTAEAFTFRGWSYSFLAIRTGHRGVPGAIRVDPDFGNPYNDIGAYLIEQGKLGEAIPWLEKATRASATKPTAIPGSIWAGCTSRSTSGRRRASATPAPTR